MPDIDFHIGPPAAMTKDYILTQLLSGSKELAERFYAELSKHDSPVNERLRQFVEGEIPFTAIEADITKYKQLLNDVAELLEQLFERVARRD